MNGLKGGNILFDTHIRFNSYISDTFQNVVLVFHNKIISREDIQQDFYKAVEEINKLYPFHKGKVISLDNIAVLLHKFIIENSCHTVDERRAMLLTIEITNRDNFHIVYNPKEI